MNNVIKNEFSRVQLLNNKKGKFLLPKKRDMVSNLEEKIDEGFKKNLYNGRSFDFLSNPLDNSIYLDEPTINNGIWEFNLKDAIVDTSAHLADDNSHLCWPFVSSSVIDVVVASKIGEVMLIDLPFKIREVYNIERHAFPPGIENYKAEQYEVDFQETIISNQLKIVSSYFPGSNKTDSRLPFFRLCRIYCSLEDDTEEPIWREILSRSLVNAHNGDWGNGILYLAMSLESFFNIEFGRLLNESNSISDESIEMTLVQTDIRTKLHALLGKKLPKKDINQIHNQLNESIFKIRNKIAHGTIISTEIRRDDYSQAIRKVFSIIWDIDPSKRHFLIPISTWQPVESLVDNELRAACQNRLS